MLKKFYLILELLKNFLSLLKFCNIRMHSLLVEYILSEQEEQGRRVVK